MSGDVQPRKRKEKKRRRDDEDTPKLAQSASPQQQPKVSRSASVVEDIEMHEQHDHGTGGHWCAKIVFFSLMAILVGLVGLIVLENRGNSDLDTPLSESRFADYLEGWVDEVRVDEHHDDQSLLESLHELDEHGPDDEPFSEEEVPEDEDDEHDDEHDHDDDDAHDDNGYDDHADYNDDADDGEHDEKEDGDDASKELVMDASDEDSAAVDDDNDDVNEEKFAKEVDESADNDNDDDAGNETEDDKDDDTNENDNASAVTDDDNDDEFVPGSTYASEAAVDDGDEDDRDPFDEEEEDDDDDDDDDEEQSFEQVIDNDSGEDLHLQKLAQKNDAVSAAVSDDDDPTEKSSVAVKAGVGLALLVVGYVVLAKRAQTTVIDEEDNSAVSTSDANAAAPQLTQRRLTLIQPDLEPDAEEEGFAANCQDTSEDDDYYEKYSDDEEETELDLDEGEEEMHEEQPVSKIVNTTSVQMQSQHRDKALPEKCQSVTFSLELLAKADAAEEPEQGSYRGGVDIEYDEEYVEEEVGEASEYDEEYEEEEYDEEEDDGEELGEEEQEDVSDIDDADLMHRLESKYGKLPVVSAEQSDDDEVLVQPRSTVTTKSTSGGAQTMYSDELADELNKANEMLEDEYDFQ